MNFVCSPLPTVVFVFFQFRRFQTELEDEFGDDVKVVSVMSYLLIMHDNIIVCKQPMTLHIGE